MAKIENMSSLNDSVAESNKELIKGFGIYT